MFSFFIFNGETNEDRQLKVFYIYCLKFFFLFNTHIFVYKFSHCINKEC
jgi:hypothetical protein